MTFALGDRDLPGIAKVAEEAGEVIQVIGKLMNTRGASEHWDGTDLRARLVEEFADLGAAIGFVIDNAMTSDERRLLWERCGEKVELFKKWHAEQQEPK